jgi:hypothetical protein
MQTGGRHPGDVSLAAHGPCDGLVGREDVEARVPPRASIVLR